MTELQLARSATSWLRRVTLPLVFTFVVVISLSSANLFASSAPDPGAESKIDYAATLDGTAAYQVSSALIPTGGNFTVEAWIWPSGGASDQGWVSQGVAGDVGADRFSIVTDGTQLKILGPSHQNVTIIPLEAWTHVAVAKNDSNVQVFVDGALSLELSRSFFTTPASGSKFMVGKHHYGSNTEFANGKIDQVKIWNVGLTLEQVQESMHSKSSGSISGLINLWDFNEEPGSLSTYDRVGSVDLPLHSSNNVPGREDVKRVTSVPGGDTVITFPRTYLPGVGGWTVPENNTNVRALVVAGGGAGGSTYDGAGAGGGGGAGFVETSSIKLSPSTTISVVVGQGGQPDRSSNTNPTESGRNGQNSSFNSFTAVGGGGGGGRGSSGLAGGSGGGGGGRDFGGGNVGGTGTFEQGHDGGAVSISPSGSGPGAGGGGAAGPGVENTTSGFGSGKTGGPGRTSSIFSINHSVGGNGGERFSGTSTQARDGAFGAKSTGNGGEGASAGYYGDAWGGAGGSGVVAVRYTPSVDLAYEGGANPDIYTNNTPVPTASNASFTAEAWVYPTTTTGTWRVVFNGGASLTSEANRFFLGISDTGNVYLALGGGDETIDAGIRNNRWTHLAVTVTGSTRKLFVDGQPIATKVYTRSTLGPTMTIGSGGQYDYLWRGQIDQVKVWSDALEADDIQESMHAYSSSGVTTNASLLAHYDFNEFVPGVVQDRSGNGKNLVLDASVTGARFSSSEIIETGTAHGEQTYAKFNRTYLTAAGGWQAPAGVERFKALVVAGGGGGGSKDYGGGGGAGGLYLLNSSTVSNLATFPVQVGMGGLGGKNIENETAKGQSGQASIVGDLSAPGGGGGGGKAWSSTQTWATGLSGGSGGGHGEDNIPLAAAASTFNEPQNGKFGNPGGALVFTGGSQMGTGGGGALTAGDSVTFQHQPGDGGEGKEIRITGTSLTFAGGGGGGSYQAVSGLGGIGGGGDGQNSTNGGPESGEVNSGGGGGGGSNVDGGHGGSGVVILSWGPYLEATQSPTVARAGEIFLESIKLQITDEVTGAKFSTTSAVTVTSSANVLTLNGVLLTQSYTVNAVDGIVDFAGLGFSSAVSGDVTLTFTSDAFVGTSLTITPSFFPLNVNIENGVTTQGTFFEGAFYASSSAGITNILVSDLANHLALYSTVVSASGYISVADSFNSGSSSDIVLRAAGYVELKASAQIRTDGGDIVLWADSDNTSGGFIRMYSNSELCTTAGTCDSTNNGGGDIVLGGGSPDPQNPGRPGGPAVGATGGGQSQNSSNTVTGVSIGVIGDGGANLFSAGGDIFAYGKMAPSVTSFGHGLMVRAGSTISSGLGKIRLIGESNNGATTSTLNGTGLLKLNQDNGSVLVRSLSTASDAVVIEGRSPQNTAYGIYSLNTGTTIDSAGGFILRSDHVSSGLDLAISVSGQVVVEPYSSSLRDAPSATSFVADFVNASDSTGQKLRLMREPGGIRIGSASNSNLVTLNTSFTSAGDIEVIGGTINVASNPEIISTGQSSKIILKARDWIDTDNGSNPSTRALLQTNDGDIVLWSDSDGNDTGWVYVGTYVTLDSGNGRSGNALQGGGRITIAGGNEGVDQDGHPLGATSDSGTNTYALVLESNSKLSSAGGNITIRAASDSNYQTFHNKLNSTINSGTGQIRVEVSHRNLLTAYRTQGSSWMSAATVSPAIELLTQTTGTVKPALEQDEGQKFELISTGDVDVGISISAFVGTALTSGITLPDVTTLISAKGDIQIQTNGYLTWSNPDARSIGAKAGSDVTSSSADITITAAAFKDATANTQSKISTSGEVKILPYATNFNADSELQFEVEAGSFEFGNVAAINSSTKTIEISRDVQVGGAITISATAVTINTGIDLVSTGLGSTILLKAKQWIDVINVTTTNVKATDASHSVIQSNNGDIIFWADSDANEQGLIWVSHNTRLNSANGLYSYDAVTEGGDIILAGGTDDGSGRPSGSAWDNGYRNGASKNDLGVGFGSFNDVFTGGGDLIIRAKAKNAGIAAFSFQGPSNFVTGTGQITIDAQAVSNVEAFEYYTLADPGSLFSSHATTSPAISISAVSANQVALDMRNSDSTKPTTFQSLASSGGGVSITANRTSSLTEAAGRLGAVNILSRNGAITLSSDAVYEISTNGRTQKWGSGSGTDVTSSSADITFNVNAWESNTGTQGGAAFSTSGVVSVLPSNANFFGQNIDFRHSITNAGGLVIGKLPLASDTDRTIDINAAQSVSGEIKIYGGLLRVGPNISAPLTANSTISLVAKANIQVYGGLFTTRGGDVWLQSRSTGAAEGGIVLSASSLYSNGGDILLSGGSDPLNDFAVGTSEATDFIGVNIQLNNVVQSSGGDIVIRGSQGSDQDSDIGGGVYVGPGQTISSGAGDLTILGRLTAQTAGDVQGAILLANSDNATAVNITSTTGDISLQGVAAASSTSNKRGIQLYRASITSEDGDVSLSGTSGSGSGSWDILVGGTSTIRSSNGKVSLLGWGSTDLILPNLTLESSDEILIQDDQPRLYSTLSITGSATVKIQSSSSAFATVPNFGLPNISPTTTGLTIGRESETGTITLSKAYTINGPITVHGGTINLQAKQESVSQSARVLLKSKGDIITTAAGDITTAGGDIILWSNADDDTTIGGRIQVVAGTALASNGGHVVFAGGSQSVGGLPAGFSKSQAGSRTSSVRHAGSIATSGGDVIIRGETPDGGGSGSIAGVYLEPGSQISAGAGAVSISGRVAQGSVNTPTSGNLWGLWVGDGNGSASIESTAGDIEFSGDASMFASNDNGGGFVAYHASVLSQTGDVNLSGAMGQKASNTYSGNLVDISGWSSTRFTISTSGNVSVTGSQGGIVDLRGLKVDNSDSLRIRANNVRVNAASTLRSNDLVIEELPNSSAGQASINLSENLTILSTTQDVRIGSGAVGEVTLLSEVSVSGDVSVLASSVSVSANIFAGGSDPQITISADVLDVTESVKATGGDIYLTSNTSGRGINLGSSTTSALLNVTDSELDQFFAENLWVGDASTADIFISGDMSIASNRVTNLILQAAGDVRALGGATLTAANLAIQAGGIVDLIGDNSVTGNVALSATGGVSYSSAVSYSPAVVAGFTPVFGVGTAVSQTNSPAVQNRNAFLAVTFNPPPQFVVTDFYGLTLDGNNRLAASYTVSATASASGAVGTVTGLTASRSGDVYSFNSLRVDSNPDTYSFTISVDDGASGFTTTSIEYSVLAGEPALLDVTALDTSAPAGATGFGITVTLKDAQGNALTAGPNAGLTVSASITGAAGVLVQGDEAAASTSNGLADFSSLVVGGSTAITYSLSFSVTYTDLNNQAQELTSSAIAITLTPGAAFQLSVSPSALTATYSATIDPITVRVLDSYSNVVTDSTATIQASANTATLSGTVGTNATSGEVIFSDLALIGSKSNHEIVFESTGLLSASSTVTLNYLGSLSLAREADVGLVGEDFMVQPLIQVLDSNGSTTTIAGLSISATVSAGASLAGALVVASSAGQGAFSGLGFDAGTLGTVYEIEYSAPGFDPVTQSVTVFSAPVGISVTGAGVTEGTFHNGLFYASSVSANILNTELNAALNLRSITLSSSADITVSESITGIGLGHDLTFRAGGSIQNTVTSKTVTINNATFSAIANEHISIRFNINTQGGNVWIQTRANDAPVGGFRIDADITTGGGDLFVSGGSDPANGFAVADSRTFNVGVRLRDITTDGGSIEIRGATSENSQAADEYGIRFLASADVVTSGGDVRLIAQLNRTGVVADDWGVDFTTQASIPTDFETGEGDFIVTVEASPATFQDINLRRFGTNNRFNVTTTTGDISISANIGPYWNYNTPVRGIMNLVSETGDILLWANKDAGNRSYWSSGTIQTSGLMNFDLPQTYFYAGQTFTGSGQVVISEVHGDWGDNVNFGANLTGLQIGDGSVNSGQLDLTGAQISINGPISIDVRKLTFGGDALLESTSQSADIEISVSAAAATIPAGTSILSSGGDINLDTEKELIVGGSITAGGSGNINLYPKHLNLTGSLNAPNGRVLVSGQSRFATTDYQVTLVTISDSEVDRINTPHLTFESIGTIVFDDPISFPQPDVVIAAVSNVLQNSGATIAATNFAISRSNLVNLPEANGVTGNLAIRANNVTYSSAVNYTAATVSGITPQFGIPVSISMTSIPGAGSVDTFLGATISPAPVATVRDTYGQPLADKNLLSYLYTVSANVATGTATLVGATASSIVGGVQTFNELGFASGSGTPTLDFRLFGPDGQVGSTVNSGIYSLSSPDPSSLSVAVAVATAPAGIASFDIVVTVRDEDNSGMSSGPNVGLTVSASVSGESVSIVSGGQVQADSSGVADFSNLVLAGSISDAISISFYVEFDDFEGNSQTISSEVFALGLTPGTATNLVIDNDSQVRANRNALGAVAISLHDAFGNIVLDRTDQITATIVSGPGGNLSGTTAITVPAAASASAVVSFGDLVISGLVGVHIIEFASDQAGIATVSHAVTLTHGTATQLSVATPASGARSGIDFGQQPVIEIQDADGNRVSTSVTASLPIAVTYVGQPASAGGVDLSGTTTVNAQNGSAAFTDLRLTGVSASYTIRFSLVGDSSFSVSQEVAVGAGNPVKIAITQQPGDILAGEQFASSVSVQIQDASGNQVSSLTGSATIQPVFIDLAGNAVATYSAVGSTAGNVIFESLTHTLVGDYRLRFVVGDNSSVSPLTSVTSIPFSISHNVASELVWVSGTEPSAASNDGVISPAPSIKVVDAYGNAVSTGPTVEVVASVTGSNTADVVNIAGSTSNSVNENVTFNALAIRALVGNYQLQFTGSVNGVDFDTLDAPNVLALSYGVPTQLAITTGSSGARAGLPFVQTPVVEVRDSAGNLVANSGLEIEATSSEAILIGTTSLSATSGTASFAADLGLAGSTSNTITLSYITIFGGTEISVSETITLLAGLPSSLRVLQDATTVSTRAVFSPLPSVEVLDSYGNLVLSDNDSEVSVALYRNNVAISSESAPVTASSGVVVFSGLSYVATPNNNYRLQFSHTSISAVVTSSPFVIEPGPVAKVVIHQQPRTITGGVATTMTGELFEDNAVVRLLDQDDNLVHTIDSGVITATIASGSDGTLISASATISNGSAEFDEMRLVGVVETPEQSAQEYKLTFSYGGFTSSESDVLKVKHNLATKLSLVQSASGGRASSVFTTQPKVRLLDRYDNWVSTGTNVTVQADVVDENSVGSPTIVGGDAQTNNGEATLYVGISGTTATTYTLRFVATTNQGVSITTVEQTGISIEHGSAARVRILRELSSDDGSGNLTKTGSALNVQPVVEVVDANDNRVLDFAGTIRASLSAVVRGERDYLIANTVSATAGLATFSSLALVGEVGTNYRINFYRDGFVGNSAESVDFALTHGDAEYLTIEDQPLGGNKTGDPLNQSPQIAVRDFDGNITTTLNGSSVSAAVVVGGGSVDTSGSNTDKALVTNGIAQFSNLTVVALPGVEQQLQFTLDGAANSASGAVVSTQSATFSLIVSDAYQLSVFTQPCTAADCSAGPTADLLGVQPVVEIQDRFGNRATQFNGIVTVTAQGTGGYLRDADDRVASVTVSAVSGLATFSVLRLEGTPGTNYTLEFSSGALVPTSSEQIQVIHTTPSQLVITTQPIGDVTGELLGVQPVLEVRDRFGNKAVTDNSTNVTVSILSGPNRLAGVAPEMTGSLTVTAVNGVVTFSDLELTGLTGANYVLRFDAAGFGVNSQAVVLSAANAMSLEWVTEPVALRTGEAMPTQPVLRLLDFDGNLASSTAATVTVTVAGGGYIEAGTTSSAVDGVVTFSGLTLVAAPNTNQTLTFTATTAGGSFSINTSNPLSVEHTAASKMTIDTAYATSAEQGRVLGTQPIIRLFDRFDNPAVNDNTTVVTATIGSGAGGAISGSATATAVGGVVTFAGLAVTGSPGVAYTLDFSAGGYGVAGTAQLRLFKTAALEVSYSNMVFSSSPTTSPAIAFTDSTENSITFSAVTTQFCTVNASTGEVNVLGAGTCVIRAEVAEGTYYKAKSVETSFVISKADQDPVVITSNAYVDFGQVLTLTSVGGSSIATTRFFATGECQILGDKLMLFGNATQDLTPTCTILASRAGDANYNASVTAPMDIEVRRIAQAPITIGNSTNVSVGDVELFIVGGSGNGTVSYSVSIGNNNAGCSVTDGILSATSNGTCEVTAQKSQSVNYNVATSPAKTFTFQKELQRVTITSAPPSMPLPGQTYRVTATASSGLSISYAITKGQEIQETQFVSYSAPVCALSQSVSGQVTFLRSGECEVTATQAGNGRFAQASEKISILVGQLNQFITFDPIADRTYGAPAFRLSAVASSNLPVSFTISAGVNVCSISNGMVNINAAGTCEIRASQAGNGTYAPAPNVTRTFVVNPDLASSPALVSAAVGNQWFTIGYTAPSYTGGSNIIGYRLEVRDQNSNVYVNSSCATVAPLTCTLAGLPNDVSYTARIAAITAAGIGQYSNNSMPLTPSPAAMSVTQLSADTSNDGLELSWIPPVALEGTFQRYEVYAWVTGTEEPVSPTTILNTSASDEVTIAISSISSAVSISPASYQEPQLQIIQPLYMTSHGIHIFGVARTKPLGFIALASIAQQSTESATVGYTMRVVTITDTRSSSQVINSANGMKVGLSAPSAPTQLSLDTSDESKIVVSWAAPSSDGGFPLIDYQVTSNGQVICANIQTRVCEVSPLTDSTTYNIEVKARNALGMGDAAGASHTTPTPPPVVLNSLQANQELQLAVSRIPQMTAFAPQIARPGSIVTITGTRLDIIRSLSLTGLPVEYLALSDTELRFMVPASTTPGIYSLVHTSEFGTVTVMDVLRVSGLPVEESLQPVVPEEPTDPSPDVETPVNPEVSPAPSPTDAAPVLPETVPESPSQNQGGSHEQAPKPPPTQAGVEQPSEPSPQPSVTAQPQEQGPTESVIADGPRSSAQPALEIWFLLALLLAALLIGLIPRLRYAGDRG